MHYSRAFIQRADGQETAKDSVRFVASTEGIKRDGLNLKVSDWDLSNYERHPVVLWGHDYAGNQLPIGTGRAVVEGRTLFIDVAFDPDDEFAQKVKSKTMRGMIAGSVGWEQRKDGKNELLEFSLVPVPADPDALPQRARGFSAQDFASEPVFRGLSISMVDLLTQTGGPLAEAERMKAYNDLARLYRRFDREAPEYVTAEDAGAYTAREWSGHFLEAEWDTRAGAVLNSRNRSDLEQARELIGNVLDRAERPKDEERGARAMPAPEDMAALVEKAQGVMAEMQAMIEAMMPDTENPDEAQPTETASEEQPQPESEAAMRKILDQLLRIDAREGA